MKSTYQPDTHRIAYGSDDSVNRYENLEIEPVRLSRNWIDREFDDVFAEYGFAALPLLIVGGVSFVLCLAAIVAVVARVAFVGSI